MGYVEQLETRNEELHNKLEDVMSIISEIHEIIDYTPNVPNFEYVNEETYDCLESALSDIWNLVDPIV